VGSARAALPRQPRGWSTGPSAGAAAQQRLQGGRGWFQPPWSMRRGLTSAAPRPTLSGARARAPARPGARARRRGGRAGCWRGLPAGGGAERLRRRRWGLTSQSTWTILLQHRPATRCIADRMATRHLAPLPSRWNGAAGQASPHRTAPMDARGCTGPGRARRRLRPGHARSMVHARAHLREEGSLPSTPGA
jgi:hypothetical protein